MNTKKRYAFCFVFDSFGRVLVLKRSDFMRKRAGEWDLPGGTINADEDSEEGMRRELREETGLHVGALELIAQKSGDWRGVNHEFIYYRAATEHVEVSLSEEHSKFEWHHPLIAGTMIKYVPHLMGLLATNHHNTDVH